MKVNVFGVGRSGTTALELYIAYWLAHSYGYVWVNNEPYTFLSRKGGINYTGQYLYNSDGYFNDNSLSQKHKKFLKSLTDGREVVVSKFMIGCGYIKPINELTNVDFSVVIVRNILDVLKSMEGMDWDLFTIHQGVINKRKPNLSTSSWQTFKKAIEEKGLLNKVPNIEYVKERLDDKYIRNGLYWYLMNEKMLEVKGKVYFLSYGKLDDIEGIIKEELKINSDTMKPIRTPFFYDKNIGQNYPISTNDINIYIRKLFIPLNELVFYFYTKTNLKLPFINLPIGTKDFIAVKGEEKLITKTSSKRVENLELDDEVLLFLKGIQDAIDENLTQKMWYEKKD